MTPAAAEAIREAAQRFADELIAALADERAAPDRLLSVDEAAAVLSIGRSKLYSEIAVGRLHSLSIGDRRLIPASAITAYITAHSPPEAGK